MTKRTKIILGVLLTAGAGLAIWYFFKDNGKSEQELKDEEEKENKKRKEEGKPPLPSPIQVDAPFPLVNGSKGKNVMALQSKIGVIADGWLGNKTQKQIEAKGFSLPLSSYDYDLLIQGLPKGYTTLSGIKKRYEGKTVYASRLNGDTVLFKDKSLRSIVGKAKFGTKLGNVTKVDMIGNAYYAQLYNRALVAVSNLSLKDPNIF